jgi:hypothetical protein
MPGARLRQAREIVAAKSAPARSEALTRQTAELKRTVGSPRPRLAGVELLQSEILPAPALPPVASAVVAKAANRRRDVRTRVKLVGMRAA